MASFTSMYEKTEVPVTGACDGWSASEVFEGSPALGLDDFVFLPGTCVCDANLGGMRVTRNVKLCSPVVSGPSRDATEEGMAISLALMGGIGFIHRHMKLEEQCKKLQRVKTYQSGFILDPACLGMRSTVADALRVQEEMGCSGIPITENGKMGSRLMGLVTRRDVEGKDRSLTLDQVMNKSVVHAKLPVSPQECQELMKEMKVAKLPVVTPDREIWAMCCRGDVKLSEKYNQAIKDDNGQLLVGAALSAKDPNPHDRAKALIDAGADVFFLEVDGIVDDQTVEFLGFLKERYPAVDVLVGKLSSYKQVVAVCDAGADGISVGDALGQEASLIFQIARQLRLNYGVPLMADIPIRDPGQLLKVYALGAHTCALDSLLRGCEEAPGDHIYRDGVRVKLQQCPHGSRTVPSSFPAAIVDKGNARSFITHLQSVVKEGCKELGLLTLAEVGKALESGSLRVEKLVNPAAARVEVSAPQLLPVFGGSLHNSW
eukprot:TRINITY_DN80214_c0_g1_i1.p1 TRINITY_DN80214_c0_g1~~TRINITY_DN80214_c0_g1_i1.p1  ORF type:complete len:511 (-),score=98.97 TRINITY_DN80214_c0_g1_i1:82-1545(-)